MSKLKRIVPTLRVVLVSTLIALLVLVGAGYWYVYGRQRELINPWVDVDTPNGESSGATPSGDHPTNKKVVDWFQIFPPLRGRLGLQPNTSGSVLSGIIISEAENWIINRGICADH
jgi:hypothetical protein